MNKRNTRTLSLIVLGRGCHIIYNASGEKFKKAGNFLEKSLGKEGAYNTPKPHQEGTNMTKKEKGRQTSKSL
jgi:hypothetical protein